MERDYNPINALHSENNGNNIVCTHENMAKNVDRYRRHYYNGNLSFADSGHILDSLSTARSTATPRVVVEPVGEEGGKHWVEKWKNLVVIAQKMNDGLYEPMTIKILTGKSGLKYYFLSNQILTPEYVDRVADEYAKHNMLIEGLKPEVFKEDVYEYNPKTCIKSFYDESASRSVSIALLLDADTLNMPVLYEMYWDKGKITANPVGSLDYGELARVTVKEWRNGKTVDLNKFSFYTFVGDKSSIWFNYNLYETPSIALSAMRSLATIAKVNNHNCATVSSWVAFLDKLYDEYSEGENVGVKIEVEDVNVYLPFYGASPNDVLLPILAAEA